MLVRNDDCGAVSTSTAGTRIKPIVGSATTATAATGEATIGAILSGEACTITTAAAAKATEVSTQRRSICRKCRRKTTCTADNIDIVAGLIVRTCLGLIATCST